MKKLLLLFAIVSAAALSGAQDMTPPKELKKLDWMLGTWSGKMKWTMPGMGGDAEMKFTATMEGMFQKQVSTMTMDGQETLEVSYLGYDPKKKVYTCWTFTNFAPTPRVDRITMSGNKTVFISQPWEVGMPGGPTTSRATLIRSGNKISMTLEFMMGKKWSKVASGSFSKGS